MAITAPFAALLIGNILIHALIYSIDGNPLKFFSTWWLAIFVITFLFSIPSAKQIFKK
jgi:hypothetical protein